MGDYQVSIIIPALNESELIGHVISDIQKTLSDFHYQIVIVDDGSLDGTFEVSKTAGADKVIRHSKTKGVRSAIESGVRHAEGQIIVIAPADGAYSAEDIRRIFLPILSEEADIVIGSRTNLKGGVGRLTGFMLSRAMARFMKLVFGKSIIDVWSFLRAYRSDLFQRIINESTSDGIEWLIELSVCSVKSKARILNVPVEEKLRWLEGYSSLRTVSLGRFAVFGLKTFFLFFIRILR